jgi:hypothetical protein
MTIVSMHRGPISGLTHLHLLRENAATRSNRPAPPSGDADRDGSVAYVPRQGVLDGVEKRVGRERLGQ